MGYSFVHFCKYQFVMSRFSGVLVFRKEKKLVKWQHNQLILKNVVKSLYDSKYTIDKNVKHFLYMFFVIILENKLKLFFVNLYSRTKLLPYLKRLCYAFPIFWIGLHLQRKSTGIAVSKAFARLIASLCRRPQNRLFTNMTRD